MSSSIATPRLVIAGTSTGVGKTTITAGLIKALRNRGLRIQPFKCGPDYIDPGYLSKAAERPCHNLDSWMLSPEVMRTEFARACKDADLAVIEGVMGLFDGSSFDSDDASAASVARLLETPVLLALDISRSARSAAATAMGFRNFSPDLHLEAFILNKAGSQTHAEGCARAIEAAGLGRVLGFLKRNEALALPERHLGLVTEGEFSDLGEKLERISEAVSEGFDLDAIIHLAKSAPNLTFETGAAVVTQRKTPLRLAVARDAAFCFYYPENLALLKEAGAELLFFSPCQGEVLPQGANAVYLGGGYPELHAAKLSANHQLWKQLRALHAADLPILAECGGFMVLTEALVDAAGVKYPMAGLVPGYTRMSPSLAAIGYRQAKVIKKTLLADPGESLRGHEFHHSTWQVNHSCLMGNDPWELSDAQGKRLQGPGGFAKGRLLASYLHLHLGQSRTLPGRLLEI